MHSIWRVKQFSSFWLCTLPQLFYIERQGVMIRFPTSWFATDNHLVLFWSWFCTPPLFWLKLLFWSIPHWLLPYWIRLPTCLFNLFFFPHLLADCLLLLLHLLSSLLFIAWASVLLTCVWCWLSASAWPLSTLILHSVPELFLFWDWIDE